MELVWGQGLDGRVKTCLLLTIVFMAAMVKHWLLAAGLLAAIITVSFKAGLPRRKLLHRMIIPFGIAWLVWLNLLFSWGHQVIGRVDLHFTTLPVYREGLELGLLILLRILAAVSAATLLSLSTPMPEILATLRLLKVPAIMIDLAEMIYRYIFLLEETALKMRRSQLSRGGGCRSWSGQVRDLGTIAANVLIRALDQSTRIYKAMLSRGYDENAMAPPYFRQKVPSRQLTWGISMEAALLALLLADYLFS